MINTENKIIKKEWISIAIVIALIAIVCVIYGCLKAGFFLDEIYTYGLSNGRYTPFLDYIKSPGIRGSIIGQTLTRQEFIDYITVNPNELFDIASVYYNQTQDVHPPLHYIIMNIFSSVTPGVFSKWTGLILNLLLYIACLFLIYVIARKINCSHIVSIIVTILYGLSSFGISTYLFIRMYMLMTFFTLLLTLLVIKLISKFKIKYCIFSGLVILGGLLTQYYFVFYAFFVCLAYVIYLLVKKEWKKLAWFASFAFGGVIVMLLIYPVCVQQILASDGGSFVKNEAFTFGIFFSKLKFFGKRLFLYSPVIIVSILLLLIFSLIKIKQTKLIIKSNVGGLETLISVLPAFVAFIFIMFVTPYFTERYVYCLIPFFAIFLGYALSVCSKIHPDISYKKWLRYLCCGILIVATLVSTYVSKPKYLYREYVEYNELLSQYKELDCVYFTDGTMPGITSDCIQLIYFDEVYVDDGTHIENVLTYLNDADSAIIYVADKIAEENFIENIITKLKYENLKLLYDGGYSKAYLVNK